MQTEVFDASSLLLGKEDVCFTICHKQERQTDMRKGPIDPQTYGYQDSTSANKRS